MEIKEIIEQAKENIRNAVADYWRHTNADNILDNISDAFIDRLAEDSSNAKQELRKLFSQSPVWDSELDALVINGTRTHDPDYQRVAALAHQILEGAKFNGADLDGYTESCIVDFFTKPISRCTNQESLDAIAAVAPNAYTKGKKPSRVFKAICVALGVADENSGSEFQRLYAQFADELTAKKIEFKMYVSINPAHFLTMSNPKNDRRGTMLTSCHSFNSTQYEYNNGCTGYARDKCSFIVFTVSDPADCETLNNRKTTRQIFAYKPGSGLLMQSRFYNTSGGVYAAVEDSKLYRDLVQREISAVEKVPNLWKTYPCCGHEKGQCVETGVGFGGYPDWLYEQFDAKVSIRADHKDDYERLTLGTSGLCIKCAKETSHGLYCENCKEEAREYCIHCEKYYNPDDMCTVRDSHGNEIQVCSECRDLHYNYCSRCEDYYPSDDTRYIEEINADYCDRCLEEYCEQCDSCGDYHLRENMCKVISSHGYEVWVCRKCAKEYDECQDCRRKFRKYVLRDGLCPSCYQENAEEAA